MNDKISVLVAARKNSKYLAKFLIGYFEHTARTENIEILVMLNEHDTWNDDLVSYYGGFVQFYREDLGLGRAGLDQYFNMLLEHATGDWIIYFCEDHYIIRQNWDIVVRQMIAGELTNATDFGDAKKHDMGKLDPSQVWVLVPSFDNAGPMNHIVSRGYLNAVGGVLARHGNLDSYINAITLRLQRDHIIRFDTADALFHDFTHDHPNPMSDAAMQSVISKEGKALPKYDDPIIANQIDVDVSKLWQAIRDQS